MICLSVLIYVSLHPNTILQGTAHHACIEHGWRWLSIARAHELCERKTSVSLVFHFLLTSGAAPSTQQTLV